MLKILLKTYSELILSSLIYFTILQIRRGRIHSFQTSSSNASKNENYKHDELQ